MYAIAVVRYRKPLEEVLKIIEAHRSYLRDLKQQGWLLASGPLDPRNGGVLLLRVPDADASRHLDQVREGDPFVQTGTAQYEIWPWLPNIGKEDLDRL
jgi:uncharacterized protein YciI